MELLITGGVAGLRNLGGRDNPAKKHSFHIIEHWGGTSASADHYVIMTDEKPTDEKPSELRGRARQYRETAHFVNMSLARMMRNYAEELERLADDLDSPKIDQNHRMT
jgi:hypothetical protein